MNSSSVMATPGAAASGNAAAGTVPVPIFKCPSNVGHPIMPGDGNSMWDCTNPGTKSAKTSYDFVVHFNEAIFANWWGERGPADHYMFGWNSTTRISDITDGTSNTAAMTETTYINLTDVIYGSPAGGNVWAYRSNRSFGIALGSSYCGINCTTTDIGYPGPAGAGAYYYANPISMHPGGLNVLFADGAVRFVSKSVQSSTLAQICTIGNGEVLNADAP